MPASNTKIKKICEWCGTRFEAQKISTKYCSHRCANLAYKKREREKNIKATEENTQNRIEELPIITIKDKEFLSFSEVGILPDKQSIRWSIKDTFKLQKLAADYLSSNALI